MRSLIIDILYKQLAPKFIGVAFLFSISLGHVNAASNMACESDKLSTKYPHLVGKTIKIGQDGESPPFSMRDPKDFNHIIGLDTDMARAVFKCIGLPVTFITAKWSGLIPALMVNHIDMMWDELLYTPERAKKIDFVSYMHSELGVLVAKNNPKHIKSLDDFCGLKVTVLLGTTEEALVRENSSKCNKNSKPSIAIITSTDIPSGLRLVQNNRADALVGNKFTVNSMATKNFDTVQSAFDVTTGSKHAVGLAKGNPELLKAIHESLIILQNDGTLKSIFEKYHINYNLMIKPEILQH